MATATFFFIGCKPTSFPNLIQYTNPLIGTYISESPSGKKHNEGTEAYSQTIPAVSAPFGMTQWTPQTAGDTEKKCVAPYYYSAEKIQGFRGTHWLGGSCVQDYGSFTLMPMSGMLRTFAEDRASLFLHENEKSTPASYSVMLERYLIMAEMTGTSRAGFFRFSYAKGGKSFILLTPNSDEGQGYIKVDPEKQEIYGYNPVHRIYQGWGQPAGFAGYFVARFDRKFEAYGCYRKMEEFKGQNEISGQENIGAYMEFTAKDFDVIQVKVGTSFTSIEEARANLDAEIPDWNFDNTKAALEEEWNKTLSTIEIKGGSPDDQVKFYTALYHSLLYPRTFNDVSGTYPSFAGNKKTMNVEAGHTYYDDFSMWDTYRAQLPLVSLIAPRQYEDMMKSLVLKAEQGGWLPIFPCWNSYTSAMIGDHCATALGDAYLKGFDINIDSAWIYMRKNAFEIPSEPDYKDGKGRRALSSYLQYGYIPLEDSVKEAFHKNEQVSRTLEYAMTDFVLSGVARKLGKDDDAKILAKRSQNYRYVFDDDVNCVRGRYIDGTWIEPFDAFVRQPYITEGSPMQYMWYVPQDVPGLIGLMGGKDNFRGKLDELFDSGEYWHANEPGHQIPFMYNYIGDYKKTQERVKNILATEYMNSPGGVPGNEDSGQMSAWYVFAAMGFYPVCPGTGEYQLSSPIFNEVTLNLDPAYYPGKKFRLVSSSPELYKPVENVSLNGKPITNYIIRQDDLKKGATLKFK